MTAEAAEIVVRPRTADDLDGAAELARATHYSDSYPRFLPTDLPGFIAPPEELAAWVATTATSTSPDTIIGHVALHRAANEAAVADLLTAATGEPAESFVLLARLLVSPQHRGAGLGRLLIDTALAGALDLGLRPALDVDQGASGPIALYEKLGWTRIGAVDLTVHDAHRLALWVYLPPV